MAKVARSKNVALSQAAPRRAKALRDAPGAATRARIFEVAERLFSERGFSGVSVREIVTAAEVNVAAIHYHFGSKESLFEETFARCAEPVIQLTAQMLDAAEEWAGQPQFLEQVLRALLVP